MAPRFLLVSLNIDAILGEVTIFDRRQKLNEITKGNHLGDAYATTLTRMKAQKGNRSRLGMEALMWVSNSERPLHTTELCHALGVRTGSSELDVETVPTVRTLLACSLGLITVDASSSTVRLVHFSLQEYLSDNPSLFQSPQSMIAEACLTYLNFRSVQELSPALSSVPPTVPLLKYASSYWGKHVRKAGAGSMTPLALKLLIESEQHIFSQLLLLHYIEDRSRWEPGLDKTGGPKGFTGLHGAAFFGIVEIFATLLAMKEWDINVIDPIGRTALAWAAVGGHEDVVAKILQQKDAKADTTDTRHGITPLMLAAAHGHEGVVKLLLEREDINPNAADTSYKRTPLLFAAGNANDGVVKLLLGREDIDPNTPETKYGVTPLLLAADKGYEGVVKLLLEREDINPNTADTKYGVAPLLWAAKAGHQGVVKLLLERGDINPNSTDPESGLTPLLWAAAAGHEGMFKLLLEREDINPNPTDPECGRTPLLWAAKGGHEGVVKLLLERDDIDPNAADTRYSRTPLLFAAKKGNDGVVKLLLEREDINPNTAETKYGTTPLRLAAENGYEGVVKLLLEHDDVDPDILDLNGKTALQLAASGGHTRVVELLSSPKPSLLVPADTDEVPEQPPSPDPPDSPQSPCQSSPSASVLPPKSLPLGTRPLLGKATASFMIISSLVFIFYFLVVISPSLSTIFLDMIFSMITLLYMSSEAFTNLS